MTRTIHTPPIARSARTSVPEIDTREIAFTESKSEASALERTGASVSEESVGVYPLTSSQREIWFDQALYEHSSMYNIGGYLRIAGAVDPERFEQAINLLARKHDCLRAVLIKGQHGDDVPMQMFAAKMSICVPLHDFSREPDPHASALEWMRKRFDEPFALYGQPLTRHDLVKAQVLLELAKIHISTGQLPEAEVELDSAIATLAAGESPVDAFTAWVALAQAQHQRGSTQQALDSLNQALKVAEEVRLQSSNPEFRASLLQPLRPAFDLKIALLAGVHFASGDAKDALTRERSAMEALSAAEQARARAFADFERLDVGRSSPQAHLLEHRRAIYRELAARHFKLESNRERMADDDVRVHAILSDITALRVKLDETNVQLNASTSAAQAKADSESWTLDRRDIPADTAIVEYWLGDKNAIAWVATRERLTMVDLGASTKITDAARAFHDSLRAFGKVPVSKRLQDSARLYALVIQPLEQYISLYHTLLFAPNGALHYIPFGALRATDRARFLIENHDIAETPSMRILLNGSRGTPAPHFRADRLLLVADPIYTADDSRLRSTVASLKTDSEETDLRSVAFRSFRGASLPRLIYTAREAASVASLFAPDRVDRLEGFAATKDRFLAAPFDRYRVIHVASHAMADAQIMGLSALALSAFDPAGKKLDNLVFAADFATLRLNADLVVLSACDTSLGR